MNKTVDLNAAELYNAKVNWSNSYLFLTLTKWTLNIIMLLWSIKRITPERANKWSNKKFNRMST